jgi:outer membrane protein TolC
MTATARADATLSLDEVLQSVQTHHPLVAAEAHAVRAADAESLSARGEFDTQLSVQGRAAALGYYDPKRADVVLEQPTPYAGSSLYAGYRIGRGNIAPYYGEQRTLQGGEVRAGVRLPLLQDRAIDRRRAGLRAADKAKDLSEAGFDKLLLELVRDGSAAYFAFVAAGQKLRVADAQLALANQRDGQIAQKVALGALPQIEALDNQRSILDRTRQRVMAKRSFEKACLDLSLFLRDAEGRPRVLDMDAVPELDATPIDALPSGDVEARAMVQRPELRELQLRIDLADIDRTLAQNKLLPKLDVFGEVSKDVGAGDSALGYTLRPVVVEVGVALSVPLFLRSARGKLLASEAKLRASQSKLSFARDKARTEVRDVASQMRAAEERAALAARTLDVAQRVAGGERERFELGASSVLFVNLREQAAADAHLALIDAQNELLLARVRTTLVEGKLPNITAALP